MIVYDAPMGDTTAPSGHQYYDANVPSMLPKLRRMPARCYRYWPSELSESVAGEQVQARPCVRCATAKVFEKNKINAKRAVEEETFQDHLKSSEVNFHRHHER